MSSIESSADARFWRRIDALEQGQRPVERHASMSMADYLSNLFTTTFANGGNSYTLPFTTMGTSKTEEPAHTFRSYAVSVFQADPVVFAVHQARAQLLSETRFKFRNLVDRKTFGTPALGPLEFPSDGMSTGELLSRLEQDVMLAGNAYVVRDGMGVERLEPDRVSILLGSPSSSDHPELTPDAFVVGYVYRSEDGGFEREYRANEVAHWAPVPDPLAKFRGMSWLTPVLREVMSDQAATLHKQKFFDNAATPNLAVKLPESIKTREQFDEVREAMEASHAGASNAWKTLYLAAGADVTVVGARLQDLDYKSMQGVYETRICNAARVPAVVAGVSEGLAGSSLNAGNFSQARRLFVDGWYRPHVRSLCAALSTLIPTPAGSELWYDDTDIGFLREDQRDAAEIAGAQASAIRQHIEAGFDADAAVAAVMANDPSLLVGTHSGLTSVQLQPAADMSTPSEPDDDTPTEGTEDDE